jgi:NADPH:quinone reductase-like Zn-dependent oxidoreductase
MKAMIWTRYGPPEVLTLGDVEKPAPGVNELLVKVHAATVTAGDCEMRRFDLPGWIWLPFRIYMGIFKPRIRILGQELAGEVVSTGKEVKEFREGDRIFVETGMSLGGYAEYISLSDKKVMARIPSNITYEEAATIPTGGINALHFVRKAAVGAGDKLLINGAGGSIGTYALQIAKSLGAEVTCVDSKAKLEMLLELGADHVIDYTREDFTGKGEKYDAIIDIVGTSPFSRTVRSLTNDGRYVLGNPRLPGMIRGVGVSIISGRKVISEMASASREDFGYLIELIGSGKLKTVIDRRYPLEQLVEAHHYVEAGHKKGNVIINVHSNNPL